MSPKVRAWWASQQPEGLYHDASDRLRPIAEAHLEVDLVGARLITDDTIARWRELGRVAWEQRGESGCICGSRHTVAEHHYESAHRHHDW